MNTLEGILLVNKESGKNSFSLISMLRKRTGIRKIGHTGTLDPLAEGLMVLLIGKKYTRQSDSFIQHDKEYIAKICLGYTTETFDKEKERQFVSDKVPSLEEIQNVLNRYQGTIEQIPPMFSAKKVAGNKLYILARKGKEIERKAQKITLHIDLINYSYPFLDLKITCSKGTYIRTLAHDIGQDLKTGGYLEYLQRTKLGHFDLKNALDQKFILDTSYPIENYIFQ
jgi:tRNA pseudouridine55 synthase